MVNKALLWGRQNHHTLKAAQNFLIVGLLSSKWHSRIQTRSVSYITQTILWRVMRCATDTSSLESIGHWIECWGIIFWVLSRTVVQNGVFRHKASTLNCFNYLWSDVKQEPREQLKFLAYWLNSVISYKHRWLDRSFLRMKMIQCLSELKENSLNSLPHILKCNQSKTLVFA